jgi:hypothetical protein
MKIRTNFVSNSSSSSFVVFGEKPESCESVELDEDVLEKVIARVKENEDLYSELPNKNPVDITKRPVYLTELIPDGMDLHWEVCRLNALVYMDGSHGVPYDEEGLVEISKPSQTREIWIKLEDIGERNED